MRLPEQPVFQAYVQPLQTDPEAFWRDKTLFLYTPDDDLALKVDGVLSAPLQESVVHGGNPSKTVFNGLLPEPDDMSVSDVLTTLDRFGLGPNEMKVISRFVRDHLSPSTTFGQALAQLETSTEHAHMNVMNIARRYLMKLVYKDLDVEPAEIAPLSYQFLAKRLPAR